MNLPSRIVLLLLTVFPALTFAQSDIWAIFGPPKPDEELIEVDGTLELPGGADPTGFIVGNAYGEATPDANGNFTMMVRAQGPTFTSATPVGYNEEKNVYVGITVMEEIAGGGKMLVSGGLKQGGNTFTIDARSTAKAMVMIHPFYIHHDPWRMAYLEARMDELPELDALEQAVESAWPNDTTPFDDPSVISAAEALYAAVNENIPAMPPSIDTFDRPTTETVPLPGKTAQSLDARVFRQDRVSAVSLDLNAFGGSFGASNKEGVGIDRRLKFIRIDENAVHDFGGEQLFLDSLAEARRFKNQPEKFVLFETLSGDDAVRQDVFLSAKSVYRFLNPVGALIGAISAVAEELGIADLSDGRVNFGTDEDAVYLIQVFSGTPVDSSRDLRGEGNFSYENYQIEQVGVIFLNIVMGAFDAVELALGFRPSTCANALTSWLVGAFSLIEAQIITSLDQSPENTLNIFLSIIESQTPSLIGAVTECLAKQGVIALGQFALSVVTFQQVTGRISAGGKLVDRFGTLAGAATGPQTYNISPMDQQMLVVGNPFDPMVESVAYEDWQGNAIDYDALTLPEELLPGVLQRTTEVILTGRRFQRNAAVQGDPEVIVFDEFRRTVVVDAELETNDDGSRAPVQTLTFTVPEGLAGEISVQVRIAEAFTQFGPFAEVVPDFEQVQGAYAYPEPQQSGGPVNVLPVVDDVGRLHVYGQGFIDRRHAVVFEGSAGTFAYLDNPESANEFDLEEHGRLNFMDLFVNAIHAPGLYDVGIRWRDDQPLVEAPTLQQVRVVGPPTLAGINSTELSEGDSVIVTGTNFGVFPESVSIRFERVSNGITSSLQADRVNQTIDTNESQGAQAILNSLPISGVDEDGTEYDVSVSTPLGESSTIRVKLYPTPVPDYTRTADIFVLKEDGYAVPTALAWASQANAEGSSGPPGRQFFSNECNITSPDGCNDGPESKTVITEEIPESWVNGNGFTRPPYMAPITINAGNCGPCDPGGSRSGYGDSEDPDTWENIASQQIDDTVNMIVPDGEELEISGEISGRFMDVIGGSALGAANARVAAVGQGLIVSGEDIDVTLTLNEIEDDMDAVVTVRNARNVELYLNMENVPAGARAKVGILVENSKDVEITGNVWRTEKGVVIKNSENVECRAAIYDFTVTGVEVDGGNDNTLRNMTIGYTATQIAGGTYGVHLKGNARGTRMRDLAIGGVDTGVWLDNCRETFFWGDNRIGYNPLFGPAGTGNRIGILVTELARDNQVGDLFSGSFYVFDCEVGMQINGGRNNRFEQVTFGIAGSNETERDAFANDVGVLVEDTTGGNLVGNRIGAVGLFNNRDYGMIVRNVTARNEFAPDSRWLGSNTHPVVPGFESGVLVENCEGIILGGVYSDLPLGIKIEDSSDFDVRDVRFFNCAEGIHAERSHAVRIREVDWEGETSPGEFEYEPIRPFFFDACSAFTLDTIDIQDFTRAGIEIVHPPLDGQGVMRIESLYREPTGSVVGFTDLRESIYDPMTRQASGDYVSSTRVRIRSESGIGVWVRDGAENIALNGLHVEVANGDGVRFDVTGGNIRLTDSLITRHQSGAGSANYDAVVVDGCDSGPVDIGLPGRGNELGGKAGYGISILNSENVRVRGNFIGTDDSGLSANPNGRDGVYVRNSSQIQIGGPKPEDGNLIAANAGHGIRIGDQRPEDAPPSTIVGNFIGVDASGTSALGNGGRGIRVEGRHGLEIADNVIAGNTEGGIEVEGTGLNPSGIMISRNIVGRAFGFGQFAFRGANSLGNGVEVKLSEKVSLYDNRIANHAGSGVVLRQAIRCALQGNAIFAHGEYGVLLDTASYGNYLDANEITSNALTGVQVQGWARANAISANSINDNRAGIVLAEGGNESIRAPELCEVEVQVAPDGKEWYFAQGRVSYAVPDGSRVELFLDWNQDGQGDDFRAGTTVADGAFFSFILRADEFEGVPLPPVVATVTDLRNNTSEFGGLNPAVACPDLGGGNNNRLDLLEPGDAPFSENDRDIGILPKSVPSAVTSGGDIYLIDIYTSERVLLADGVALESYPVLGSTASTSTTLVFESDRNGTKDLFVTNLQTTQTVTLLAGGPSAEKMPDISSDGSEVVFVTGRDGNDEIYVVNTGTGALERLTFDAGSDQYPVLSPDGRKVAFVSSRSGTKQIHLLDRDSGTVTQLTELEDATPGKLSWSPEEDLLAIELSYSGDGDPYTTIGWLDLEEDRPYIVPVGSRHLGQPDWALDENGELFLLGAVRGNDGVDDPYVAVMNPYGAITWRITRDASSDELPSAGYVGQGTLFSD